MPRVPLLFTVRPVTLRKAAAGVHRFEAGAVATLARLPSKVAVVEVDQAACAEDEALAFTLFAAWRGALAFETGLVVAIRSFVAGHSFSGCTRAKCRLPSIGVSLRWLQMEQATSFMPAILVKLSWGAFSLAMAVPFHESCWCASEGTLVCRTKRRRGRIVELHGGLRRSRSSTRAALVAVVYARAARADSSRTPIRRRHLNRLKSQRGQRLGAVSCFAR